MMLFKNLNKVTLALVMILFLGACATQQATTTKGEDAYTGTETVKFLADGVPDRVFFSTNKSELTSAATTTLEVLEDHAVKFFGQCIALHRHIV